MMATRLRDTSVQLLLAKNRDEPLAGGPTAE